MKSRRRSDYKEVEFSELFSINPDGTLTPKRVVTISGATIGPGVSFGRDLAEFENANLIDLKGNKLAITEDNSGTAVIKGYYTSEQS